MRNRAAECSGGPLHTTFCSTSFGADLNALIARRRSNTPEYGLANRCWMSAVFGLDASREMIARARKKATGAGTEIDFHLGSAEAQPFSEATFDVVLSTTVFHCLPDRARHLCIREMARVLKPSGRLLLIDFGGSKRERRSLIGHLRAHRNFDVFDLIPTINESGLTDLKNGSLGFSDLQFLIATRSGSTSLRSG
jgi:SAM-dependent methyltransferase